MHTKIHSICSIVLSLSIVLCPALALAQDGITVADKMTAGESYEQDLILTAYYSPLPHQCCYVKGSYEADMILNGRGTNGADGTEVYAGMIAAPPSYPFGTRIRIPGIGTMTVHDRGGAIQEWEGAHRIDVWAGKGEEGLARALAFGVQRVRATVYPRASKQPEEAFNLADLPAPVEKLRTYLVSQPGALETLPAAGEKSLSVRMLQEGLQSIGYMQDAPTGYFGPVTQASLASFYKDFAVTDSADRLTDTGSAYLQAAVERKDAKPPVAAVVDRTSTAAAIAQAKRTLRYLGFYDGRTNGTYDQPLFVAILSFQKSQGLVSDASSPGAGRIGPRTRARIVALWGKKMVALAAEKIMLMRRIDTMLAGRNDVIATFMGKGAKGGDVRTLQSVLAGKGLLQKDQVTGLFGNATEKALVAFQVAAGVIMTPDDQGAGYVGPATLRTLREEKREEIYRIVRAQGWSAI